MSDLLRRISAPAGAAGIATAEVLEPILIDIKQAARLLSVSERTLRDWKDVPRFVKGGRTLYSPSALRRWVEQQMETPAVSPASSET